MAIDGDLQTMTIEEAREIIVKLFNLFEEWQKVKGALQEEIERLRAEIRRLKGEPGPPSFAPKKTAQSDLSSERERHERKPWTKRGKIDRIRIDRTVTVAVDRSLVPSDSVFKGYEEVVIQDLIVRTDTVLFRKEKLYSPSTGRTYLAPLPPGYEGQFGPELKALAVSLAFGSNVSEAKIREFFGQAGILISAGGLSNLLIHGQDRFHEEKGALFEAGLRSTPWHHLDETSTAVKGVNHSCHGVCNPLYTAYFTLASKGRLSVLEALRGGRKPLFILNVEALKILEESRLPKRLIGGLACLPREERLTEEDLGERLSKANLPMGPQQKAQILAALALAAYHTEAGRPRLLAGDDAPQFKGVADALALCWIHEGRPNKKLQPALPLHQRHLQAFLTEFWDYYRELGAYRARPSEPERARLVMQFDALFGQVTGYVALDARIALTRGKKTELLEVLSHPEIPLHNNPAELGARRRVRKRDVSFGPQNTEGTRAWDTFMTLGATTAQLGIPFYEYLKDRITQAGQIPPLATVLAERASALTLGSSWAT